MKTLIAIPVWREKARDIRGGQGLTTGQPGIYHYYSIVTRHLLPSPPKFARIRFILSSFSAAESISLIRELAAWKMERGDWVGLGIEGFGNRILSFFFSLSLFFLFVEEYRRTSEK